MPGEVHHLTFCDMAICRSPAPVAINLIRGALDICRKRMAARDPHARFCPECERRFQDAEREGPK